MSANNKQWRATATKIGVANGSICTKGLSLGNYHFTMLMMTPDIIGHLNALSCFFRLLLLMCWYRHRWLRLRQRKPIFLIASVSRKISCVCLIIGISHQQPQHKKRMWCFRFFFFVLCFHCSKTHTYERGNMCSNSDIVVDMRVTPLKYQSLVTYCFQLCSLVRVHGKPASLTPFTPTFYFVSPFKYVALFNFTRYSILLLFLHRFFSRFFIRIISGYQFIVSTLLTRSTH